MFAVQASHWALALVPVLILLAMFVSFDAFKLMSRGEMLLLLPLVMWIVAALFVLYFTISPITALLT